MSNDANGVARWFTDGQLNTCYCAIDYHVEQGRGEQTALIYDSPVTNTVATYTYSQVKEWTARVAGGLRALGVAKGDVVIIYMPMVPETVIAMLACARIGAVHSVVFGGFAADELAMRIDDATPKVVLAASCGIETDRVIPYQPLLNGALDLAAHKPAHVVMLERPQAPVQLSAPGILTGRNGKLLRSRWTVFLLVRRILCTSSTHRARLVNPRYCSRQWRSCGGAKIQHVVGLRRGGIGDVYWAASDVGWVVGHSYIVYGPLLAGCTTVVYEGKPVKTPDAGAFWRVLSDHRA